jgi:hypothetical protein
MLFLCQLQDVLEEKLTTPLFLLYPYYNREKGLYIFLG